jgi:hypothetical protein
MPAVASTSGRLHSEFVRLLFLQAHRETDRFFAASRVQLAQHDRDQFQFRRVACSAKCMTILWHSFCITHGGVVHVIRNGQTQFITSEESEMKVI